MRRRVIGGVSAGIVLLAAAGIYSVSRMLSEPAEIAIMRDSLQVLRAGADSCRKTLERGQADLHAYNARIDSLRGRVHDLESHDPRGVPADSYAVYIGVVEQYNDSVDAWDPRVESLQEELESCRELTEAHNQAARTLRRLLVERRR